MIVQFREHRTNLHIGHVAQRAILMTVVSIATFLAAHTRNRHGENNCHGSDNHINIPTIGAAEEAGKYVENVESYQNLRENSSKLS